MDHRSGMWRRKSSGKNSGESESSGSVSSYSERYSDEQEVFGSSPTESSLNHVHSPEISSVNEGNEGHGTVKRLTEKLSAALLDVAAKEDLVKQHAKVTEEAISGWETAEAEVAALKQQLETSFLKSSALEDRISHLEEALKECVKKLRQSRLEEEQKVHDFLIKTNEWESNKRELENQLKELYAQLQTAKTETFITTDNSLCSKVESLERENKSLKTDLFSQSEQLRRCALERELSTQAAESASKQHLDSIKKVAKLESECRRLQTLASRTPLTRYQRPVELLPGVYNEEESLDSWASALIAQLDQFKQEKACTRDTTAPTEIDLMDDFLEMERLVATPETDHEISVNNLNGEFNTDFAGENTLRNELGALQLQVVELEKKVEKMEDEKAHHKMEAQNQLEASYNQLALAGDKLADMQRKLGLANESMEATRKDLQSELNSAYAQAEELSEQVSLLVGKVEEERALSAVYSTRAEENEAIWKELEVQLMLANSEVESLNKTVSILKLELQEERLTSAKLADRAEIAELARNSLENQLELTNSEVERLLEEVDKERALSVQYSAKCQVLEEELLRKKEAEIWRITSSNGVVKLNKEKELAEAAGKLAECQKTIASLGRQLKSLRNMDEFMLEAKKAENDGCMQYISFSEDTACTALCDGKESYPPLGEER